MGSDQDFKKMLEFVTELQIQPILDQVYPLDKAVEAFDRIQSEHHFGKNYKID